ncbi:uncharacterized protein VP01_12833g1, partial [Puccinia sorghi]
QLGCYSVTYHPVTCSWPAEPEPRSPSNSPCPASHLWPSHSPSTEPVVLQTSLLKGDFAVSFMTDYAATWSHPYLMKFFNAERWPLTNDFLVSLTTIAYTMLKSPTIPPPNWNSVGLHTRVQLTHLHCSRDDTPRMSLHQHGLKENLQLAVVMRKI